ncbi:MAG: hypothetical protein ABI411_17540 [Tahibacter sp.]
MAASVLSPIHRIQSAPLRRGAATPVLQGLIALFLLLGLLRGVSMLVAQPLVALANNYDQVRYTACFGIFPVRPGVDPTSLNYRAPLEDYAFQEVPGTPCYLSSDLVFQASATTLYRWAETRSGVTSHSVRLLGGLRLLAWLLAVVLLSRAFWRERRGDYALANAAWFAGLGMDPVNSIYLNTFYAESGVLYFAYLCIALAVLLSVRATALRWCLLVLACIALATSKLQHMLLPLFIAAAVAVPIVLRRHRYWAVLTALLIGGSIGVGLQLVQMQREHGLFAAVAVVNNTDLVLSALLPASADPAQTTARLGLGEACVAQSGKNIYKLDIALELACPGAAGLSRLRVLGLFFSEPGTLLRMLARVPPRMLPWLPDYLGLVAADDPMVEPIALPEGFFSVNRWIGTRAWLCWCLILAPLPVMLLAVARRGAPTGLPVFAAACAAVALSVPCVTVFGDGFTETAKQAHLALNAGCGVLLAIVVAGLARWRWPHA